MLVFKTGVAAGLALAALAVALPATVALADPVISAHPRLLLSATEKNRLLAKKNANDASWQRVKARADTLATYSINRFALASRNDAPAGTIYYTYQGEGWFDATLPLAFAYQMTGDTRYSNKLIELAQEMIRAQSEGPIQPDNYYPSRNLMSVLAFIYDYCYDQLSASLKSQIVTLMNDYFDDVSVNGYQAQNYSFAADGAFFGGHLYGVALIPAPITSTSYRVSGAGGDSHTLMGLVPSGLYSVTLVDGVVRVDRSASGNKTASAAGVLHFTLSSSPPPSRRRAVRH